MRFLMSFNVSGASDNSSAFARNRGAGPARLALGWIDRRAVSSSGFQSQLTGTFGIAPNDRRTTSVFVGQGEDLPSKQG